MKPDLNLLVVLDALCRSGSVTQAAEMLSLSQPAVSHALNRLRAATGDPLFTRSGRGLVATPRARALAAEVAVIVSAGQACLGPESFDAARDRPRFRLGVSDYAGLTLLPGLMKTVLALAPHATVEALPVGPGILRQLEDGALDLSFWGTSAPRPPFHYLPLLTETYVVVLRADHPALAGGGLTPARYLRQPHAVVSLGDPGQSPVEAALAGAGQVRRIALISQSFAANFAAVAQSDLLATVPAHLAITLPQGLVTRPVPFAVAPFDYGMIWHPRTDAAPAPRWLRRVIAGLVREPTGQVDHTG
jgi:DNA-binding transcriptional LysR family regulator